MTQKEVDIFFLRMEGRTVGTFSTEAAATQKFREICERVPKIGGTVRRGHEDGIVIMSRWSAWDHFLYDLERCIELARVGMAYDHIQKFQADEMDNFTWLYEDEELTIYRPEIRALLVASDHDYERYEWPDGSAIIATRDAWDYGFQRMELPTQEIADAMKASDDWRGVPVKFGWAQRSLLRKTFTAQVKNARGVIVDRFDQLIADCASAAARIAFDRTEAENAAVVLVCGEAWETLEGRNDFSLLDVRLLYPA